MTTTLATAAFMAEMVKEVALHSSPNLAQTTCTSTMVDADEEELTRDAEAMAIIREGREASEVGRKERFRTLVE